MNVLNRIIFVLLSMIGIQTIQAEIITYPSGVTPGSWLCFRKEILVEKNASHNLFKIAADSKYWLWINGELVVREGGLKRGPNPKDTYCDILQNVKGFVAGKNTVTILVWYFGKEGFSHRNSPTAGVSVDMTIGKQQYVSDDSWKVCVHPSFYIPEGIKPNCRLPESNIGFNAQKEAAFWAKDFDDTLWLDAKVVKKELSGWNLLIERPIPMWKDYGLKDYVKVERKSDTLFVAYLPYNAQVNPYIKLKSKAGRVIDIRTDNYRGGGVPNVYTEYITKSGIQEFEAWGWMNGHQVLYTIPKDVEVLELKFRETG